MKKRLFSMFLALILILALVPAEVFAEEILPPEETAAESLPAETGAETEPVDETAGETAAESVAEPENTPEAAETPVPAETALLEETEVPAAETEVPVETEETWEQDTGVALLAVGSVYSGTCGDNLTWVLEDGVLTVSGTGEMTEATWAIYGDDITSVVICEGVTSICGDAFYCCDHIASVSLPETLKVIESYAFTANISLQSITIPSSVTEIWSYAFSGCSALTGTLVLPEGLEVLEYAAFAGCKGLSAVELPSTLKVIDRYAFENCSSLTAITLPEGLLEIRGCAFDGCKKLESVNLPGSLMHIGKEAFGQTPWLAAQNDFIIVGTRLLHYHGSARIAEVPAGVTYIGAECFAGKSIAGVSIPSGVTEIAEEAFSKCGSLTGVTIPDSVSTIGDYAFYCCWSLADVALPAGLTALGEYAFAYCSALRGIVIPDGVTSIGLSTFDNCKAMKSAGIPASVTGISMYAFDCCSRLTEVDFGGTEEQWQAMTRDEGNDALESAAKYYGSTQVHVHTPVAVTGYAASCTEAGLTDGSYCSSCGRTLVEQTVVDAPGHSNTTEKTGYYEDGYPLLRTDCSRCGASDTITGAKITVSGETKVRTGASITLSAAFDPYNVTGTQIKWTMSAEDKAYASIKVSGSKVTVTAKAGIKSACTVTVKAYSEDGLAAPYNAVITIIPNATSVSIWTEDTKLSGGSYRMDMNQTPTLQLRAESTPEGSDAAVKWTSSDTKIATVSKYGGMVTAVKPGKVTITATATDGSKKTATFTLRISRYARSLTILNAPASLLSGSKKTLKTDVQADTSLTNRDVVWSLRAEDKAFATIKNGVLTAKTVYEPVTIEVTAYAAARPEVRQTVSVVLRPATTSVRVYNDGTRLASGSKLHLEIGESAALTGACYPEGGYGTDSWKTGNKAVATVAGGVVTGVAAGTTTVTYSHGGKSISVKVTVGTAASQITFTSVTPELRSGKAFTFKAVTDEAASVRTVSLALKNAGDASYCTLSGGKLTAKTVYEDHVVTVLATATDGSGVSAEYQVTIKPASDNVLVLRANGRVVNGKSILVKPGEQLELAASNAFGEELSVKWRSSDKRIATVSAGLVTAKANGSAQITVTASGNRTTTVTVKVASPVTAITAGVKNGAAPKVISGKSITLSAKVNSDATSKAVKWYFVDSTYASYCTLDAAKGILTGKSVSKPVTVEVYARATDGSGIKSEPVSVTIYPAAKAVNIYYNGMAVNNLTVRAGTEAFTLTARVLREGAQQGVRWRSSDTKIATVDSAGNVTVLKPGQVTFTCTASDGSGKYVQVTFIFK